MFRFVAVGLLILALLGLKKMAGHHADAETRHVLQAQADASKAAPVAAATAVPALAAEEIPAPEKTGDLSDASLDLHSSFRNYPRPDTFTYAGRSLAADYDADSLLSARTSVYLQRYHPETGIILVSDLKSGRILAVGERQDTVMSAAPRMTFTGRYPAASLIKILTASAAMDFNGHDIGDSIPILGRYYTLYKRQLKIDKWDGLPKITMQEAFAKSVNPAFGVLGQSLGAESLRKAARRLGFNRSMLPECASPSHYDAPDTGFALAEVSCGFTPKTTISPWHALQIARGIGDDGRLRNCAFANSVTDITNKNEIPVHEDSGSVFISAANLPKLQALMEGTVRFGTARKSFHSVLQARHLEKLDVGGKTGSLDGDRDGDEPQGRYDWFIGYARLKEDPSVGLAVAVMLVHHEYLTVHSAQLAALLIRDWLTAYQKAHRVKPTPAV